MKNALHWAAFVFLAGIGMEQLACTSRDQREDQKISAKFHITENAVKHIHSKLSVGVEQLAEMKDSEVQGLIRELHPDLPGRRAFYRNLQLGNVGQFTPPQRIVASLLSVQKLRQQTRRRMAGGVRVGLIEGLGRIPELAPNPVPGRNNWVAVGPNNIGGRTRSIVIDPHNPSHIWLGSLGGGIWYSADVGATFKPVDDFMGNLAICCMAMDPTNSNIIYAGTGEGFYNTDAIQGAGIFWTSPLTGGQWQVIQASVKPEMLFLTRIAVSADGKVVLASGHNNSASDAQNHAAGIFRSEKADRSDWSQVSRIEMADVKFHPKDPKLAIAGGADVAQSGAWYSVDGGKNWSPAAHNDQWTWSRVEVTYAKADPSVVYALVDRNGGEVWKSTNGGKSYSKQPAKLSDASVTMLGQYGFYANTIWAGHPTDPNLVLAGGTNLWRSTDGGKTLQPISDWTQTDSGSIHADHHAIVADPAFDGRTNKTVYFGDDGGIYRTRDVLKVKTQSGWENLNSTYATTQFYGGSANGEGSIVAGAQDNGTLELQGGADAGQWQVVGDGDGGMSISQGQGSKVFFGEYIMLDLQRFGPDGTKDLSGIVRWNDDGTPAWKPDPYVIKDSREAFADPNNSQNRANFISSFAMDPNGKRIYAGGASLWRTNDAMVTVDDNTGPVWEEVKKPLQPGAIWGVISAVALRPGNPKELWLGYNSGRIFRTQNATDSPDKVQWEELDSGPGAKMPKNRMCTRIAFDAMNPQVVYATFAGYFKDNIWTSIKGGKSWNSLSANLVEMPIYALAIHPRDSRILYLGSELGVYVSTNTGVSWSPANSGPANCSVQDLFWMGQILFAATHGRGIFKADVSLP